MTGVLYSESPFAAAVEEHFEQVERTARHYTEEARRLIGGKPPNSAHDFAGLVMGALREVDEISAFTLRAGGHRPGCMKGCAHCCFQPVTCSTAEVVAIAVILHESERERAIARARSTVERSDGDANARYRKGIPCPFLERGECGIHPLRPQACRTHFSISRLACDREWRARHHRNFSLRAGIPMPTAPKAAGYAVMLGLDTALHEVGLEVELVELSEALPLILAPGAVERWLRGERVFAEVAKRTPETGQLYSLVLAMKASETG